MTPEEEEKLLKRLIMLEENLYAQANEASACQQSVYDRLNSHDDKFKAIDAQFEKQSAQRKAQNEEVMFMLTELKAWTKAHGEEEMTRLQEHTDTINKLIEVVNKIDEQTKSNSSYVASAKYNDDIEKRVAKKIKDISAPREELLHKVKMTSIVVITTGVLYGLWYLVKLLYALNLKFGVAVS